MSEHKMQSSYEADNSIDLPLSRVVNTQPVTPPIIGSSSPEDLTSIPKHQTDNVKLNGPPSGMAAEDAADQIGGASQDHAYSSTQEQDAQAAAEQYSFLQFHVVEGEEENATEGESEEGKVIPKKTTANKTKGQASGSAGQGQGFKRKSSQTSHLSRLGGLNTTKQLNQQSQGIMMNNFMAGAATVSSQNPLGSSASYSTVIKSSKVPSTI